MARSSGVFDLDIHPFEELEPTPVGSARLGPFLRSAVPLGVGARRRARLPDLLRETLKRRDGDLRED